jgi:spermidine synthase
VGQDVGIVYLVNTLGAIAGSVATGFVLIPLLGVQATLGWGLAANLVAVALGGLLLPGPRRQRTLAVIGAAAVGLLAAVQPAWPPVVFDAGLGQRHDSQPAATPLELAQKLNRHPSRLRFSREGVNATITVRQLANETVLYVNGKPDASTGVDMGTQALLGLLPALAHPAPRDLCVVGWGSGVSVYAATFFPEVRRIDAIEIERAVIEASPTFRPYNGGVEAHPRVHIIYDDARSTLVSGRRPYDVIISEPSNPWMVGVSSLFTADFYRLVKRRLRPRGVFGQWFQLYNIDSRSVAMVLTTVLSSFEHVQLWFTDPANAVLLASDSPLRFDIDRLRRAYRADRRLPLHMAAYGPGPRPEQLFGAYLLDGAALRRLVKPYGVEPLSDDLPTLEFRAARNLYYPVHQHIERLLAARLALGQILPPGVRGGATATARALAGTCNLLAGRAPRLEQRLLTWGLARLPARSAGLRICHARGLVQRGSPAAAAAQLDALDPRAGADPQVRLLRARIALDRGRADEALELLPRLGGAGDSAALWHTLRAAVRARQHALAWSLAGALVDRMRRGPGDAGLRRISRAEIYDQIGRLMHDSRGYRQAIRLLGPLQERHGGELSRLLVLLDALRAAGDLAGAARVLDRLQAFGIIDAHQLQVCAQVYREVGRRAAAAACQAQYQRLVRPPVQRPLW